MRNKRYTPYTRTHTRNNYKKKKIESKINQNQPRTCVASGARPTGPTVAMELFWHLSADSGRVRHADRVAFAAVQTGLGGARIQHDVAVRAAKPFGTRARVPIRRRALARSAV